MNTTDKENLINKIIKLKKQLTKIEESEVDTHCLDYHKGVYYCFKLIKNRHWVSYIGFPEYININNKKYYYLDNEEPEVGLFTRFDLPSEVTLAGCGMDVNVMSNIPLKWLGFDYAHRGDLTIPELKNILSKVGENNNIDTLSECDIITLQKDKFYTYEDIKKDCIDCIDSATECLIETAISNLTGDFHREINKHTKK